MVNNIATRTVSQLPVATSLTGNDQIVVQQSGITKQSTVNALLQSINEAARLAIDINEYGPVGNGDADEDTLAWTRALAASASLGLPVVGSGTYYIKPDTSQAIGMYAGSSTLPGMYGAVPVPSGAAVDGYQGITFVPSPPDVATSASGRLYLFYSPQPIKSGGTWTIPVQGAVSNISFSNCTFMVDDTIWPSGTHPFTFMFDMCGVDGFREENNTYTTAVSTPYVRSGRGGFFSNCINRRQNNNKYVNFGQGQFVVYDYYAEIQNVYGNNVAELMDFDAPCYGNVVNNVWNFNGAATDETIDTGGGYGCRFSNIYCQNTGAIFLAYIKPNYYSNFTRWVQAEAANVSIAECQVPTAFVLENITGVSVTLRDGEKSAIGVGQDRQNDWRFPNYPDCRDLVIRNVNLKESTGIFIAGAENITLDTISFTSCQGLNRDTNPNLLVCQSTASAGISDFTRITGTFRNIYIKDAENTGIRIEAPSTQVWDNIRVNSYGTALVSSTYNNGIQGVNFNFKKGDVTFGRVNVGGGVSGAYDFYIRGTPIPFTTSAGPNRIHLKGPFTFTTSGGVPPNFTNDTRYNIVTPGWNNYLVQSVTTSNVGLDNSVRIPVKIQPIGTRARFLAGNFAQVSAVTSSANYSAVAAYTQSNGTIYPVSNTTANYDNQNWTAGAVVSIGTTPFTEDGAIVSAGSMFGFSFIRKGGSGSAFTNMAMSALFFEWNVQASNGL